MVFRILVKEKLILGDIWSLWTGFQKPKVVVLDFKIACEINFCHLGVILVPKTFILNGIWSFPVTGSHHLEIQDCVCDQFSASVHLSGSRNTNI